MAEREKGQERADLLPIVSKETVLETLSELAVDKVNFTRQVTSKIISENPDLAEIIITNANVMPDPELALLSSLCLYECYSVQAGHEGKRLFQVAQDVINVRVKEILDEELPLLFSSREEELSEKFKEDQLKTIKDIENQSPALDTLMATFLLKVKLEQDLKGAVDASVSFQMFFGVFKVLKAQDEANRLKSKFE